MLEIWDLTFWPQLIERGGGVILEGSEPRSHLASVKQLHGEEQALTFAQRSPG